MSIRDHVLVCTKIVNSNRGCGDTDTIGQPPVTTFCPFLDLVNFDLSGTPTVNITNNTVVVVGTDFQQASQVGSDAISSATDIIPFEVKFSALLDPMTLIIIAFDGADAPTNDDLAGVVLVSNQASATITDLISAIPIASGVDTTDGYIGGIEFDMATGTARYKDNRSTDELISVDGSFSNANPIFLGMRQSLGPGDGGTFELNAGDKAFEVVSGTLWCKATPPPPSLFCSIAQFSVFFESLVSSIITDNNVVATNTTAGQGAGIYLDTGILVNVGANILVAEITINSLSSLTDGTGALTFGTTDLVTGEGFAIDIQTGSGDGKIIRTSDSAELITGLSLTLPYTAQLIVDGNTGNISFNDGTNSTLLSNVPTVDTLDGSFVIAIEPPTGLNETGDVTANLGSQAMTITPPPGSKFHCELTQVP